MAKISIPAGNATRGRFGRAAPSPLSNDVNAAMIEAALEMNDYLGMGTVAAFTSLHISSMDGLRTTFKQRMPQAKSAEEVTAYLLKHGKPLVSYYWSGYIMGTLLVYLQEKRNIDLMTSEFDEFGFSLTKAWGRTTFILTSSHKRAHLEHLKPTAYSAEELRAYYEAFNQRKNEDAGKAMLDGIALIRTNLFYVTNESVIVLTIG